MQSESDVNPWSRTKRRKSSSIESLMNVFLGTVFFSPAGELVGRLANRESSMSDPKPPVSDNVWALLLLREVIARCMKMAISEHLRLAEELRKKA